MEKNEKAWYVAERTELMSGLFLQELGARNSLRTGPEPAPLDYVAIFGTDDLKLRIIGVEVKSTEKHLNGQFRFQARADRVKALQSANVPILILVVNVKHNEIYYGWAKDIEETQGTALISRCSPTPKARWPVFTT